MILTLLETKEYLKIDFEDEDTYIKTLIGVAEEYLSSALGKDINLLVGTKQEKRAKLYLLVLINDWYSNRGLMEDSKVSNKVRYTLNSILMQLRYSV